MKIRFPAGIAGSRDLRQAKGIMLLECLIYIAVLAVVMSVAFSAFYRSLDHSRDLVRNSEEILRVLRAGELWRGDVRSARARPRFLSEGGVSACEIPQSGGVVAYILADGVVWRKAPNVPPRQLMLHVKSSKIISDQRHHVASWRWEIELQTRKKNAHVRPVFTFQAVPAQKLP